LVSDYSDLPHRIRTPSKKRTLNQINACLRLGIWLCVTVSTAIVVVCAAAYLTNSALFKVRHIEIRGAFHLKTDEVLGLLDIEEGDNILTWDMNEARLRLEAHPWVRELRISRGFFPTALVVEVTERRPLATLVLKDRPYLISEEGVPFMASPEVFYGFLINARDFGRDDMAGGLAETVKNAVAWAGLVEAKGLKVSDLAIVPGRLVDIRLKNSLVFTVFGRPDPAAVDRAVRVMRVIKPVEGTVMDLRCGDKIVLRTRGPHGGEG
jgi:cell division septal protein FtsQ